MPDTMFGTFDAVGDALGILARALDTYEPEAVYALFSGGHDSLCSTRLATLATRFRSVVHINTGIGVRQTREYVRDTCRTQGWPLLELHPPPFTPAKEKRRPGIDYENLPAYVACILHYGFPGPAGHRLVYNRVKERCLRALRRHTFGRRRKKGQTMLLVGGMRRQESTRRMGNAEAMSLEPSEGRAWCAPLLNWSAEDKNAYIARNGLPRNPVVEKLCMSGECLCGAYARPQELVEIEAAYPEAAAEIRRLQELAKRAGVHCEWGKPPPQKNGEDESQPSLFGLCWSCGNKWEATPPPDDAPLFEGQS